MHLGYRVGSNGVGGQDSVAGNVRTVDLATATIPVEATNLEIDIRAYGIDTRAGDATADSKLRLYATTESRALALGPVGAAPILISGGDMGILYESLQVSRNGADVSGAVVSITGVTIPTQPTGYYTYNVGTPLAPGSELVVRVELDGDVVEGRATLPPAPVLTLPVTSQVVTLGQPVNFAWTAAADPSFWYPSVQCLFNGRAAGGSTVESVAATARTAVVSTALIPSDATDLSAKLVAYLRGTFTGPAEAASTMHVRIESNPASLVKGP